MAPNELMVSDLKRLWDRLTAGQAWSILVAVAIIISAVFWSGYELGSYNTGVGLRSRIDAGDSRISNAYAARDNAITSANAANTARDNAITTANTAKDIATASANAAQKAEAHLTAEIAFLSNYLRYLLAKVGLSTADVSIERMTFVRAQADMFKAKINGCMEANILRKIFPTGNSQEAQIPIDSDLFPIPKDVQIDAVNLANHDRGCP